MPPKKYTGVVTLLATIFAYFHPRGLDSGCVFVAFIGDITIKSISRFFAILASSRLWVEAAIIFPLFKGLSFKDNNSFVVMCHPSVYFFLKCFVYCVK